MTVAMAVVLCLVQQSLQQLRRLVDMPALQERLQYLIDRTLSLGFAVGCRCWRCLPSLLGPQSVVALFKASRQVMPHEYLLDYSFDFCKAHGSCVDWPQMATGSMSQSLRLEGLEPLKLLSLFVLLQNLAKSNFL